MTPVMAAKVATRFKRAAPTSDLVVTLERGLGVLKRMRAWHAKYPIVLVHADTAGLPKGWAWQSGFVDFFKDGESLQGELEMIDDLLEDIKGEDTVFASLARDGTSEPPRTAQIDHALSVFDFFPDAMGEDNIAYTTVTLREWGKAFGSWLAVSTRILQGALQKAQRTV